MSENSTFIMSMTGFGHSMAVLPGHNLRVEIRTLNHRGLDLKLRVQDCCLRAEVENEILRLVRQNVVRGSVQVIVKNEARSQLSVGLEVEVIKQLFRDLSAVQSQLELQGPLDLQTLGVFLPAVRTPTALEVGVEGWEPLRIAVVGAVNGLKAMRQKEGDILAADLMIRLNVLRTLVVQMQETALLVPVRVAKRLQDRLATLGGDFPQVEPGRWAQEVAILTERYDVSEELVRLRAHFDQAEVLLREKQKDPPGRKLDFLAQEMGRELNTLGAKIQDSATAALVVSAKSELEKLREQAQNIE